MINTPQGAMSQNLQMAFISQKVIPCLRVFTITSRQVGAKLPTLST